MRIRNYNQRQNESVQVEELKETSLENKAFQKMNQTQDWVSFHIEPKTTQGIETQLSNQIATNAELKRKTQDEQEQPNEMEEHNIRTQTIDWNYEDMIRKWKWRWNEKDLCGCSPWEVWTRHLEVIIQDKCLNVATWSSPITHKMRQEEGETILTTHTLICI